jgi:hypothetical protein
MRYPVRIVEKERRAYQNAVSKALAGRVRGTGWRKYRDTLIRELDGWFFCAQPGIWLGGDKFVWILAAKPMDLDPTFWRVLRMRSNEKESLSLRAVGAFVCDALPIARWEGKVSARTAAQMATAFLEWADGEAVRFACAASKTPFSKLVKQRGRPRDAYAETLVSALIAEGRLKEAARVAEPFASGQREAIVEHYSGRHSFFELARDWSAPPPPASRRPPKTRVVGSGTRRGPSRPAKTVGKSKRKSRS